MPKLSEIQPAVWFDKDPLWYRMPLAKQELGLRRLRVMRDFDAEIVRSKADAREAAALLGVKLRSFYALLKKWREAGKSPYALVPHETSKRKRKSRLGEEVSRNLVELAEKVAVSDPCAPVGALLIELKRRWPGEIELPSDVTLRAYLRRARANAGGGRIPNVTSLYSEQPTLSNHFGETVIVDHASLADIMIQTAGGIAPAFVTLAIDEYTGRVLGQSTYAGQPSTHWTINALSDAIQRAKSLGAPHTCCPVNVRISEKSLNDGADLRRMVDEIGLHLFPISKKNLKHGEILLNILQSNLDGIRLFPIRRTANQGGGYFDAERKSLLTLKQAHMVVANAVDRQLEEILKNEPDPPRIKKGKARNSIMVQRNINHEEKNAEFYQDIIDNIKKKVDEIVCHRDEVRSVLRSKRCVTKGHAKIIGSIHLSDVQKYHEVWSALLKLSQANFKERGILLEIKVTVQ